MHLLLRTGLLLSTALSVLAAPSFAAAADARPDGSAASRLALTNSTMPAALSPPAANDSSAPASTQQAKDFPSNDSDVKGHGQFIDSVQVGYFWSASRRHHIVERFAGPPSVKEATLKLDVVENFLRNGAHVEWIVSIDGMDVGRFEVVDGQLGPFTEKYMFDPIASGSYRVKMRVANDVAGGEGSHTLRYAGDGWHSIKLT